MTCVLVEGRGRFKGVKVGDPFAGGTLTDLGAREVNLNRLKIVSGSKDLTVGEYIASHVISEEEIKSRNRNIEKSLTTKKKVEIFRKYTEGESEIFPDRK
jgi:hypothetical protein